MPYNIKMKLFRTKTYEKRAKKLLTKDELSTAEHEIFSNPEKWPVIQGGGGIRKARAARGNSGKSGGVRIIYYFMSKNGLIYLLDLYAKNQQDNLTDASKKYFKDFIKSIGGQND